MKKNNKFSIANLSPHLFGQLIAEWPFSLHNWHMMLANGNAFLALAAIVLYLDNLLISLSQLLGVLQLKLAIMNLMKVSSTGLHPKVSMVLQVASSTTCLSLV